MLAATNSSGAVESAKSAKSAAIIHNGVDVYAIASVTARQILTAIRRKEKYSVIETSDPTAQVKGLWSVGECKEPLAEKKKRKNVTLVWVGAHRVSDLCEALGVYDHNA